jgi:type 2 lantibiotic biosynthesis protein LanM
LVYKPKDLGTDEAYFSILDWCNGHGAPLEFRALRVLRKQGYGWETLVDQRPCDSEEKVRRYYLRAGQLLCVIYVLAGTDCHFDNLIACGEQPILIDTEMLFQPRLPGEFSGNRDTVMRTGLLPGAQTLDLSGLGSTTDQPTHLRVPEWQHVNSDRMRLSFRPARLESRSSVVMRGDTPVSALDYVDSIVEGFRHMYRFLMTRRGALLASDGPLASIAGQKVRILARGTMEYLLALSEALHPKHLRSSDCLQIRFTEPSRFPGLEPCEIEALERMDVPRFLAQASAKVWSPSVQAGISIAFFETGLERVLSGIEQLSEAALERQLGIIKLAWAMSGLSKIS